MSEQTTTKQVLVGADTIKRLVASGAQFCNLCSHTPHTHKRKGGETYSCPEPGKIPFYSGWQEKPKTEDEALSHLAHGGNVGLVCGELSNFIGFFDADEDFQIFLDTFPVFKDSPRAIRTNAPERGKILIATDAPMPSGRKFYRPGESKPFFEFLGKGNQGVIAGTHDSGAEIQLINQDALIPYLTHDELEGIVKSWTRKQAAAESSLFDNRTPPEKTKPVAIQSSSDDLVKNVLAHWDLIKILTHWGKVTAEGIRSVGGEKKIMGNGGLFVDEKTQRWNRPGEKGVGGGALGAWQWCKTGSANVPRGRAFIELLEEMATVGGISIPIKIISGNGSMPKPTEVAEPIRRWTVAELYDTEFPEPRWAVPGLIPEGLTILGGRPKVGKSWMALQIAYAVGTGGRVLDREVEKGRVLYLALEDSPRRLKKRTASMKVHRDALIEFQTEWLPLHRGGLDILFAEIEVVEYRLVVIDTLERACPGVDKTDETAIGPIFDSLQRMGQSHNLAILINDHLRKFTGTNNDPVEDIIGSTAKTGIADTILALYKQQGRPGAILQGRGRETEELSLQLTWNSMTTCWQSEGDATEIGITERRREILEVLDTLGPSQLDKIAKYIGQDRSNTFRRLQDMTNAGLILRYKVGTDVYYEHKE